MKTSSITLRKAARGCALLSLAAAALLPAPRATAANAIYWTENDASSHRVMKSNLDGSGVTTVLTGSGENGFSGIAFDVANGHFYSGSKAFLFRANLDGSGRVNLVPTANQSISDVELDLANGKVYWTEGAFGINAIHRANLDGSDHQVLANEGSTGGFNGIALDVAAGKIYFSFDVNVGNDTIGVMNLDGTSRAVLHNLGGNVVNPYDVEFDSSTRKLYWNSTTSGTIFVRDLNNPGGVPSAAVVFPAGAVNGFHVDSTAQKAYAASAALPDSISRANLDGSGLQTPVTGRPDIFSIEVMRDGFPDCAEHFFEINLSKASYATGESVVVSHLTLGNPSPDATPVELKMWVRNPSGTAFSLLNVGADGSTVFPAGFCRQAGPLSIFNVTAGHPRGAWEIGCRVLNPVTGEILDEDVNPFTIQ